LSRIFISFLKCTAAFLFILISLTAIYLQSSITDFKLTEELKNLKAHHRRDDAIDLVAEFKRLLPDQENSFEYGKVEKLQSLVWHGIVKGQVFDFYSGVGAMTADLCLVGDLTLQRNLIKLIVEISTKVCHTAQQPLKKGGRPCYPSPVAMSIFTRFQSLISARAIFKTL
jgi:hypothetical protein